EFDGKVRWQSGQYLTITGNTSTGARRADYVGGDIDLADRSAEQWFNTAAFATAPDTRRGNATVGQVQGPHLFKPDLTLKKNFRFAASSVMEVRLDAFNAIN